MGLTLRLADSEDQPQPQCVSCCAGTDHTNWNSPQQGLVPSRSRFGYAACEANRTLLCRLELAIGCVGSGASREGLWCSQCHMLLVTGPGQPVWSYSLWLPLMDLGVYTKDQAVHQDQLLLAPGPGASQQKSQGIPRSTSAFLHLPAAF